MAKWPTAPLSITDQKAPSSGVGDSYFGNFQHLTFVRKHQDLKNSLRKVSVFQSNCYQVFMLTETLPAKTLTYQIELNLLLNHLGS